MKVKELREALANLPDDYDVVVWLPGSRIDLTGPPFINRDIRFRDFAIDKEVLLEGNLRPGSALEG
jgi:hypothetical protein